MWEVLWLGRVELPYLLSDTFRQFIETPLFHFNSNSFEVQSRSSLAASIHIYFETYSGGHLVVKFIKPSAGFEADRELAYQFPPDACYQWARCCRNAL